MYHLLLHAHYERKKIVKIGKKTLIMNIIGTKIILDFYVCLNIKYIVIPDANSGC